MAPQIRPAELADAAAMWELFYLDAILDDDKPPRRRPPVTVEHHIRTGTAFVAEDDARIVGFVSGIQRDDVLYVSFLFIDRSYQSESIGKQLLQRLLGEASAPHRQIISAHNFSAVSLYIRNGFEPVSQIIWAEGKSDRLEKLPANDIEVVETDVDDPVFRQWDLHCSGVSREVDLKHWVKAENGQCVLFREDGNVVGYGIARIDSPAVFTRDQVTCGPIGYDAEHASDVINAFLKWGASRRPLVRMSSFLSNPALPSLLEHGLRITYLSTYLNDGWTPMDPGRYCPSDWEL